MTSALEKPEIFEDEGLGGNGGIALLGGEENNENSQEKPRILKKNKRILKKNKRILKKKHRKPQKNVIN